MSACVCLLLLLLAKRSGLWCSSPWGWTQGEMFILKGERLTHTSGYSKQLHSGIILQRHTFRGQKQWSSSTWEISSQPFWYRKVNFNKGNDQLNRMGNGMVPSSTNGARETCLVLLSDLVFSAILHRMAQRQRNKMLSIQKNNFQSNPAASKFYFPSTI